MARQDIYVMYTTHTAYYKEIKKSVKTKTSIFLVGGLTMNKFGMLVQRE